MNLTFSVLAWDALDLVSGVTLTAVIPFVLMMLFLVIALYPLKQVDRRDMITGWTYTSFMAAVGALLVIVVPSRTLGTMPLSYQVLIFVAVCMFAMVRWNWHQGPRNVNDKNTAKKVVKK
jgi:hypothetical protein